MAKIKIHTNQLIPSHNIRAQFAKALSDMYRFEVPLYGALVDMIRQINQQELDAHPEMMETLISGNILPRLSAERHGAIRLGKAEELFTMRRLFAVMGMSPVSYYDLTVAGIPVHSTAFRPIQQEELNQSPFRVFTSLLRLDLIPDETLRFQARQLLAQRQIFTQGVLELIDTYEQQNGLTAQQASHFVAEALHTFRWHHHAITDIHTYQKFLAAHRLIADIICFKVPHINHLTPRTLNIDKAQQQMQREGMNPKAIIEGPPKRKHDILLRQTSFKAVGEDVIFTKETGESNWGIHTARFGEIEQRGMALTPKGMRLYDQLLKEVHQKIDSSTTNSEAYYRQLGLTFEQFPDDLTQIRDQGLGYFNYQLKPQLDKAQYSNLKSLVDNNILYITPLTYEDFLPVSAAGIFQSNLDDTKPWSFAESPNRQAFEKDLGCAVFNEFELYAKIQQDSLVDCLQQLELSIDQQLEFIQQLNREMQ